MNATDALIEKMKQTPIYQDRAFQAFCLHPLAPQLLRQVAAGQHEEAGVLIERTFDKILRDLAVAKELGVDGDPWNLKEQA